jgi:hypothetical protein
VAWATVKAFDAAGGPPGATRRAADLGRQAASKRLPDAQASRGALFLACRPISAVPHLSLVRKPGYVFAFHDREEIGPKMLARIARHTGLTPEDL